MQRLPTPTPTPAAASRHGARACTAGEFCPAGHRQPAKCWWNTPARSSAGRRRKTATPRPQPAQPTFYFHVDEDRVIDANYGGNSARWINHSCDPNCFADERDGRIFITALRNIKAGEELNYDYGLIIEERYTPKLKAEYPCWCGAATCRGTLLAPSAAGARPCPTCLRQSPHGQSQGTKTGKAMKPEGPQGMTAPSAGLPRPSGRPWPRCCRASRWKCCPASIRPTPS